MMTDAFTSAMLFTLNELVEVMKLGVKAYILAHTCKAE
jgi:hypothetical protein